MKTIKMNNINNLRAPMPQEIQAISRAVERYEASSIKTSNVVSSILTVLGLTFMGSIGVEANASVLSILLGLLCFLAVFSCIKSKKGRNEIVEGFRNGEFIVLDGKIQKFEVNPDTPGCINAWFLSNDNTFNDGWYKVRQENAQIGTPVILVYPNSERTSKFYIRLYTAFMLTDEGINLLW